MTLEQAEHHLLSVTNSYRRMGCPDIADTVRIVKRTATLTRSDWTPVE
jgi:hypothetical protein